MIAVDTRRQLSHLLGNGLGGDNTVCSVTIENRSIAPPHASSLATPGHEIGNTAQSHHRLARLTQADPPIGRAALATDLKVEHFNIAAQNPDEHGSCRTASRLNCSAPWLWGAER